MNTTPFTTLRVSLSSPFCRRNGGEPSFGEHPLADDTARNHFTGNRALVLGGGGSAGNAWLIGVVAGLFDAGLDVTDADAIFGTSAGATAAAQLTSTSTSPPLLY